MIMLTAVLMILTLLDWELSVVRVVFAVALVAILPGYAVMTTIFLRYPLDFVEKVAFSCGLSLGISSLGGLFLHFTRWGLQPVSWIMLLGGITIIANVLSLIRIATATKIDYSIVQMPIRFHQLVLVIMAGLIVAGAYTSAYRGAKNRPTIRYTQIWMLWSDESQTSVKLGVRNEETTLSHYRIQLSAQQGYVEEWPLISLEAGELWETEYTPPPNVSSADFIRASLYKLDDPQTRYREVYLRRIIQ